MKCKKCQKPHDGSFGSGIFCSKSCAQSRVQTNAMNLSRSGKLIGRKLSLDHRNKLIAAWDKRDRHLIARRPLSDILIEDSKEISQTVIKRLVKENIRPYECEECGLSEWQNKPITLQLHHINGINNDHRSHNIMIICPNCHSQTANFAGKNRNKGLLAQLDRANAFEA